MMLDPESEDERKMPARNTEDSDRDDSSLGF